MSYQNPITVIAPVLPEKLNELYDYLDTIKFSLEQSNHEKYKFESLGTIHYLRWLIIDDKDSGNKNTIFFQDQSESEPKLVFSSNFDGSVDKHLNDLCDNQHNIYELIDDIYSCCVNYPDKGKRTKDTRKNFLKKHIVKASAFYRGSPNRSLKQIMNEKKLRTDVRDILDNGKWDNLSSKEVHKRIKTKLENNPANRWMKESFKMPRKNYFKLFLLCLTILILLPIIIIWIINVQLRHEKKDKYFTGYRSDIDPKKTENLEEYEDLTDGQDNSLLATNNNEVDASKPKDQIIFYQNQFSQLVEMKPGKVRLLTFKGMMLFARKLIPAWYVDGELMNIPTIHFARWVLFDDNKRVLFFSNFDGSWQQYLGDFIDQSGWGLSAIFANTTNFPKTNWLGITGLLAPKKYPKSGKFFPGGAYDEERFLAWSRSTELSTQIWYSAYPDLSIKNVNNNSRIRVMLNKNLSEKKAKEFFELI